MKKKKRIGLLSKTNYWPSISDSMILVVSIFIVILLYFTVLLTIQANLFIEKAEEQLRVTEKIKDLFEMSDKLNESLENIRGLEKPLFPSISWNLTYNGEKRLNKAYETIRETIMNIKKKETEDYKFRFIISGHSDMDTIKDKYGFTNWTLSSNRAASVVEYLNKKLIEDNLIDDVNVKYLQINASSYHDPYIEETLPKNISNEKEFKKNYIDKLKEEKEKEILKKLYINNKYSEKNESYIEKKMLELMVEQNFPQNISDKDISMMVDDVYTASMEKELKILSKELEKAKWNYDYYGYNTTNPKTIADFFERSKENVIEEYKKKNNLRENIKRLYYNNGNFKYYNKNTKKYNHNYKEYDIKTIENVLKLLDSRYDIYDSRKTKLKSKVENFLLKTYNRRVEFTISPEIDSLIELLN